MTGFVFIAYGIAAGYIGYLIGCEAKERKSRTKRPSIYMWTWIADKK